MEAPGAVGGMYRALGGLSGGRGLLLLPPPPPPPKPELLAMLWSCTTDDDDTLEGVGIVVLLSTLYPIIVCVCVWTVGEAHLCTFGRKTLGHAQLQM